MMSEALKEALINAGWTPERRISTCGWVAQLKADSFELLPQAEEIIASFGGLTLRSQGLAYQPPVVFFDPAIPGGKGDVARIPVWERKLGVTMNPIAELSFGASVLALASDGRVYSVFNGTLYLYGESLVDALENCLMFGKRIPQEYGHLTEADD